MFLYALYQKEESGFNQIKEGPLSKASSMTP